MYERDLVAPSQKESSQHLQKHLSKACVRNSDILACQLPVIQTIIIKQNNAAHNSAIEGYKVENLGILLLEHFSLKNTFISFYT